MIPNFEGMNKEYQKRVDGMASYMVDRLVMDHLLKGGDFDAQKITKLFGRAVCTAQLIVDLTIGTGLNPLEEEKNDENSEATGTRNQIQGGIVSVPTSGPNQNQPVTATDANTSIHDEVSNLRSGNPEGPTGGFGNEGRVRNPNGAADQVDDHGATGGREIDSPQQQSVPTEPRPGTGWGHSSGPEGPPFYPHPIDAPGEPR